ncbi:MAG: ABC transporter substrate-binding protein [Deltaproteobacteria bacterium]|nr:ABC transporter substrate-binding protein [Deltaproteobacteria bacterium]MBQ6669373.1 ABC transporter substrate-binding protein [Deltaproteobacteria bacterium]
MNMNSLKYLKMAGSMIFVLWSVCNTCAEPVKKWRVIYVEGGSYTDYQQILRTTAQGLAQLGAIQRSDVPIPKETHDTRPMWDWLCEHAGGDRLEFLKDGYYSANWSEERRAQNKAAILERIRTHKDVDMILAFGTRAGLDMATDEHQVPVMSISVTDAVKAGIIKSIEDSGRDHVHALVDPGRYQRQIVIFHNVFHFKRLGVPYENTPEGRSACAFEEIERTARQLGVAIVPCATQLRIPDKEASFKNLQKCVKKLSISSDAIYMTISPAMQGNRMKELLTPLIEAGIPSFSQNGSEETRLGVLMSIAQNDFSHEGMASARAIVKVMDGTKPRDISQIFTGPLGMAINLKMAMLIGWDPPLEVLAAVDRIYLDLSNAREE